MEIVGKSRIAGIGAYLPKQVVYSDDLMLESGCIKFGTPQDYISKRIGIIERRVADDQTQPSDMAISASCEAMKDAGISAAEIGLILYCGIDRDWEEPATAHRVQVEIGATASCFDVTNACHGFMDGISIANAYISTGAAENVLVCTGEKQSKTLYSILHKLKKVKDKSQYKKYLGALTVGDAGGAMIIQRCEDTTGLKWMQTYSEGKHSDLCYYRNTKDGVDGQMLMREITVQITRLHQRLIDRTYEKLNWEPNDIDAMYCHQVGQKPHEALVRLAGKSVVDAPVTYPYFGNLTSATIPVNMAMNRPKRGQKLLLMGTGSGLSICQAGMVF